MCTLQQELLPSTDMCEVLGLPNSRQPGYGLQGVDTQAWWPQVLGAGWAGTGQRKPEDLELRRAHESTPHNGTMHFTKGAPSLHVTSLAIRQATSTSDTRTSSSGGRLSCSVRKGL